MTACCSLLVAVVGGCIRCEIACEITIAVWSNAALLNAYLPISGWDEYMHRRGNPKWLVKETHI